MTERAASLAARYKTGFEHSSEAERKRYLQKHPQADPSKHTVKAPEGKKPKQEEGGNGKKPKKPEEAGGKPEAKKKPEEAPAEHGAEHEQEGGGHGEHQEEGAPKPKKNFFKSLSEGARAFLSKTSKEAQKFVADPAHRKQVLGNAAQSIKKAPEAYAKRLVQTAKHEVHEFKEAGQALASIYKKQPLDHHQKKALKTVAIHMGIALTAAALGSTGVLAGAIALGKGMAQKIALKAAAKSLEKVHLVQEISHIGHGIHELMHFLASEEEAKPAGGAKVPPEEAFAILVMRNVIKELQNFSDEDMADVVEKAAAKGQTKTASAPTELAPAFAKAKTALDAILSTLRVFPRILTAARSEATTIGNDRVWQERPVGVLRSIDATMAAITEADELFDKTALARGPLANIALDARSYLVVPRKATVEYAISDIDFATNPNTGREGISYSVGTLRDWASELEKWATAAKGHLKVLEQKAARVVRNQGSV